MRCSVFNRLIPVLPLLLGGLFQILASAEVMAKDPPWPSLTTDGEKLEFLLWVSERFPGVLEDTVEYNRDWFELLQSQHGLLQKLKTNAEYQKLLESRGDLLQIDIRTTAAEATASRDHSRLSQSLLSRAGEIPGTDLRQSLETRIRNEISSLLQSRPNGLGVGLIQALPKDLQRDAFQRSGQDRFDYLARHLPDPIPSAARLEEFGLTTRDKTAAMDLLKRGMDAHERIEADLALYLLGTRPDGSIPADKTALEERLRRSLAGLGQADYGKEEARLQFLRLSGVLSDLSPAESKAAQGLLKDRLDSLLRPLYRLDSPERPALRLVEVPAQLGIFRGCSGNDCATKYSFGYPNSPSEHVFLVYDGKDRIKGYTAATLLEADGKPSLYVHTISGTHIGSEDTRRILNALHSARGHFGAEDVTLPTRTRIWENVNYSVIRDTMGTAVAPDSPPRTLKLGDSATRKLIDATATVNYDKEINNKTGFKFVPFVETHPVVIDVRPATGDDTFRRPITERDAVSLALDHEMTERHPIADRILKAGKIPEARFQALVDTLYNDGKLKRADFLAKAGAAFADYGVTVDEAFVSRHFVHFQQGFLNCPDILAPEGRPVTAREYANLVRVRSQTLGTEEVIRLLEFNRGHLAAFKAAKPTIQDLEAVLTLAPHMKVDDIVPLKTHFLERPEFVPGDFASLLSYQLRSPGDAYIKRMNALAEKYVPKFLSLNPSHAEVDAVFGSATRSMSPAALRPLLTRRLELSPTADAYVRAISELTVSNQAPSSAEATLRLELASETLGFFQKLQPGPEERARLLAQVREFMKTQAGGSKAWQQGSQILARAAANPAELIAACNWNWNPSSYVKADVDQMAMTIRDQAERFHALAPSAEQRQTWSGFVEKYAKLTGPEGWLALQESRLLTARTPEEITRVVTWNIQKSSAPYQKVIAVLGQRSWERFFGLNPGPAQVKAYLDGVYLESGQAAERMTALCRQAKSLEELALLPQTATWKRANSTPLLETFTTRLEELGTLEASKLRLARDANKGTAAATVIQRKLVRMARTPREFLDEAKGVNLTQGAPPETTSRTIESFLSLKPSLAEIEEFGRLHLDVPSRGALYAKTLPGLNLKEVRELTTSAGWRSIADGWRDHHLKAWFDALNDPSLETIAFTRDSLSGPAEKLTLQRKFLQRLGTPEAYLQGVRPAPKLGNAEIGPLLVETTDHFLELRPAPAQVREFLGLIPAADRQKILEKCLAPYNGDLQSTLDALGPLAEEADPEWKALKREYLRARYWPLQSSGSDAALLSRLKEDVGAVFAAGQSCLKLFRSFGSSGPD